MKKRILRARWWEQRNTCLISHDRHKIGTKRKKNEHNLNLSHPHRPHDDDRGNRSNSVGHWYVFRVGCSNIIPCFMNAKRLPTHRLASPKFAQEFTPRRSFILNRSVMDIPRSRRSSIHRSSIDERGRFRTICSL